MNVNAMDGKDSMSVYLIEKKYMERGKKKGILDYNPPKLNPRARPMRSIRMISSPLVSSDSPARQSQPRPTDAGPLMLVALLSFLPSRGTRTPELAADPEPDVDRVRSSMSLPINEKLLDAAVVDETDFFSNVRGDGGRTYESDEEWCSRSAERKNSSHWPYTRVATVSRSSMAERMVSCCVTVRIDVGSALG